MSNAYRIELRSYLGMKSVFDCRFNGAAALGGSKPGQGPGFKAMPSGRLGSLAGEYVKLEGDKTPRQGSAGRKVCAMQHEDLSLLPSRLLSDMLNGLQKDAKGIPDGSPQQVPAVPQPALQQLKQDPGVKVSCG